MTQKSWPARRVQRGASPIGAGLALALVLVLVNGRAVADGAPPSASASASAEKEARKKQAITLHDEALELHAHGRYRDAVAKLETALALDPEGKELVYNLALIHERLGEIDPALRYYRRYLEVETNPKEREKIQSVILRLEGAKQDILVAQEEARAASPPPRAPPRVVGPWVIAAGAVGAAGLLTGVVLGVSALARSPGADAMTGPGVTADDLLADARAAHRQAVGADVALLIGLAGAGAAVGLYFGQRPAPARALKPSAARIDVTLGPLAGALRVSF